MRNPFAPGTGLRRYTRKHLVHDRNAARAKVVRLEGELRQACGTVRELRKQVAQMRADAVDVGVERQLREAAEQRADVLSARLTALEARDANANAVTVPPAQRPIDPDEKPTEPRGIAVLHLSEAHKVDVA